MSKADLIIHPIRLHILRELSGAELTTQELSERLVDVPASSIYRHMKLLLDGDLVQVADTRMVNGIQEKTYRLTQPATLGPGDVANWTAEDHLGYFITYALTLIHDFNAYVSAAEEKQADLDFLADRAGYREVVLYATTGELDAAIGAINAALLPLLQNEAGNGDRRKYKLATILHPMQEDNVDGQG